MGFTKIFGKYYSEFYIRALWHFLFAGLGSTLFALGLEFTQGPKGEHGTPYFMPAMVLGGLHFIQTLACLVNYKTAYNPYTLLKTLYLLLLYINLPWGVVGASIAGNAGICVGENACYYTENFAQNRIVCAFTIVIHALSFVFNLILLQVNVEDYRVKPTSFSGYTKRSTPQQINKKPTTDNKPNENNEDVARQLNTQKSLLNKKVELSSLKLTRPKSADNSSLRLQRRVADDKELKDVKPLPRKNRKLKTFAYGLVFASSVGVKRSQQEAGKEDGDTSTSSSSSSDEISDRGYRHKRKSRIKLKLKQAPLDHPPSPPPPPRLPDVSRRLPPPSYDEVVPPSEQEAEGQPYWIRPRHNRESYQILPLPRHESVMRHVPGDIYSGSSYPDTDLVPAQPLHYKS